MGNDSSNSGSTPYGSQSHYVVATGIDRNGKLIVEDSESRTSGDRYDLASTLANSSVKITTGMGKETLLSKFISNTANAILVPYGKILRNILSTSSTKKGSTSGSVGGNPGDASKMKGKSLTLTDDVGNTHTISITDDEVELYAMLTGECGLSPAAACGAIGNWEQECGINSIKNIATKGVIYYGGGIMQWTPGSKHENWARDNGFSGDVWSWEANLAHAKYEIMNGGNWSNPANASPSFASQGLTPVGSFEEFKKLSDPESAAANFERVFEVSGDWNGRNSEGVHYSENMIYDRLRRLNAKILYELIVNGKSDSDSTGKGRSKANRILSRFGKGTDGYDYESYYRDSARAYKQRLYEMNELKHHRGAFANTTGPAYDAAYKRIKDDLDKAEIQYKMAESFRANKNVGKSDAEAFEVVYGAHINKGNRFPDKYGTVIQDKRTAKEIAKEIKEDESSDSKTSSSSTSSSSSAASSGSKSLLSIISNDIITASKKLFGPLYDALFGDTASEEDGASMSSGVPGDVNTNFNGEIVAPFRGTFRCSCRFGWYNDGVHPNGHNGTDLLASGDTDEAWTVYSLCDGVVTHVTSGYAPNTGCLGSSDGGGAGNYVEITGTDGYIYQFMHLNAIHQDIKENAQVYIGSPIGIGGHTGSSTGRHLHFGIKKSDGTFINPEVYIMGFPNDDIVEYQEYESHLFTGKGKKAPKISMSEFKFGTARSKAPERVSQSRRAELAMRMRSANKKIYNTLGAEQQSQRRKLIKVRSEDNHRNPQLIQTGIYADPVHNTARRNIIPQTNIKINGSDAVVTPVNSGMGRGGISESSSTINLELTSVVDILKTIADNSARNEQIVQLLAAIVANTAAKNGDTTTADLLKLITTAGGNSNTSAPITALNSILNNSTGKDISSAVYQIAKN
jgi:murein DD-endopeptidase MepM/ murein hydrolase activator NlpD